MIRRSLQFSFFIALAFMAAACASVQYTAPDFAQKVKTHRKIAILPFHMVFSGKMPKNMTDLQRMQIEEAEAMAFQKSLYNAMLNKSGAGKKDIYIEIQRVDETNRLLKEKGISIRTAWEARPEELAKTLGVDAVVRSKVEKVRYLSDLASYGIDLAEELLVILQGQTNIPLPPGTDVEVAQASKTHDISSESELINGADGSLLWKQAVQTEADWSFPANEIIDGLNRRYARKFPYVNSIR